VSKIDQNQIAPNLKASTRNGEWAVEVWGEWNLDSLAEVWPKITKCLSDIQNSPAKVTIDARNANASDISGAYAIRSLQSKLIAQNIDAELLADKSLDAVFAKIDTQTIASATSDDDTDTDAVASLLGAVGRRLVRTLKDVVRFVHLAGILVLWMATLGRHGGLRLNAITTHMHNMGVTAIPIVFFSKWPF